MALPLDPQQITEALQRSVSVMCQYAGREDFAELYTFLVEAVYVPKEALEHDLVFEVGKQRAACLRSKLFAHDDA